MRILGIFLNSEIRSGGHRRYLELMEALAARGGEVRVVVNTLLGYGPRSFAAMARKVPYRRKGFPPASWIFRSEAVKTARELRREGWAPEVVLVFGETHLEAGSVLARRLGARLVYGHRSNVVRENLTYLEEGGWSLKKRLGFSAELLKSRLEERRIARLADLAVFQSGYDRDDFLGRVPGAAPKAAVIRGDISGPRFKREFADSNRSGSLNKVVFMGSLGTRKGAEYLIEAITMLRERGLDGLRFDICGGGERRGEFEDRLARSGASGMATFLGRVEDPFPVIAAADLLVVPSLFDSYPNTALEALHVGTPVIGSRVGGIPDILGHDDLLFPPMDGKAIADRIERCVREPGFYERLKRICAERAGHFRFDWAAEWERAIGERFGGGPCASR